MRKKLLQIAAAALCLALCVPSGHAARQQESMVRVGLAHGSGALAAANLENNTGYGAGYRFGYFDEDLGFVELAESGRRQTAITVLRASEMYMKNGQYTASDPGGGSRAIGCYHVVLGEYRSLEDAQAQAEEYGGFAAWIDGRFQAREGAYLTQEEAQEAMERLGGEDVRGTSAYAVNVVETGSADILFQFDGGSGTAFGIMPDVTGAEDVRTWFKGYKYRGGFRYERLGGGDLTVVNILEMEEYIKGVIPYELRHAPPPEAQTAQAVRARTSAWNKITSQGHRSGNFDLCATEDCQVYHGVGTDKSNYQATSRTDRAVEETAGMYALYQGQPIEAFYASSHGGASERVDNVWNSSLAKYPYLCGVIDPYEQNAASVNSYSSWTKTWTMEELARRLQDNNFPAASISSLEVTYSELGNAIQVKINYTNGKSNTLTPKMLWGLRSFFNVSSLHFTINGQGTGSASGGSSSAGAEIRVNESGTLDTGGQVYAISGTGRTARADLEDLYTISGTGSVDALEASGGSGSGSGSTTPAGTVVTITDRTLVLQGAGNGHQIGMSQYGAYAMAEEGFSYDEIVEFYFPGTQVREY